MVTASALAAVLSSSWQRRKAQDLNTECVPEGKEPAGETLPSSNPGRRATAFPAKTKDVWSRGGPKNQLQVNRRATAAKPAALGQAGD